MLIVTCRLWDLSVPEREHTAPRRQNARHYQDLRRGGKIWLTTGGEGGIRTLGTGLGPYNCLAGSPVRPLRHLSKDGLTNEGGLDRFLREPSPKRLVSDWQRAWLAAYSPCSEKKLTSDPVYSMNFSAKSMEMVPAAG
jgi:hypothetical protein